MEPQQKKVFFIVFIFYFFGFFILISWLFPCILYPKNILLDYYLPICIFIQYISRGAHKGWGILFSFFVGPIT